MKVNLQLGDEALIALRDIGHAAARDETRLSLTGVSIQVTKQNVWAIATNAYLLVFRHIAELDKRDETFEVVVQAEALTAAAKASYKRAPDARRRAKQPLTRAVTISSDGIELATEEGSVSVAAYTENPYPDTLSLLQQELKRSPEPLGHVAFNPAFVAQIGRALGATDDGLQFEFFGLGRPALVATAQGKDERSIGLLMPIIDAYTRRLERARREEEQRRAKEAEHKRQKRLARRRKKDRARRAAKRKAA